MLEVTRELDRRLPEIQKVLADRPPQQGQGKVRIAGADFVVPTEKTPKVGWQTSEDGWDDVLAAFERIKKTPTDGNWVSLDTWVRGILMDDKFRLVYWDHPLLQHDSEEVVSSALASVSECLLKPLCLAPAFVGTRASGYVQVGYAHGWHWARSQDKARSIEERRKSLTSLESFLKRDLERFKFVVNPSIRISGSQLMVPLIVSDITEGLNEFRRLMEAPWMMGERSILLEASAQGTANVYAVNVDETKSGRAFVAHSEKTLQLYNGTRTTTIGHELGHVLGFKDNYFTSWNSAKCAYLTEYREDDIMSEATTGKVLPEHWSKLESVYGVAR